MTKRTLWDKFWKDKRGRYVVLQDANLPLMLWAITFVPSLIMYHGLVHDLLETLSFGFIFMWAFLEITTGDSYFRRLLGLVVMVVILMNRL